MNGSHNTCDQQVDTGHIIVCPRENDMTKFMDKQFGSIPDVSNEEYEQHIHVPDTNLKPLITYI